MRAGTKKNDAAPRATADAAPQEALQEGLAAALQVLPLPAGLYLFAVMSAAARPRRAKDQLSLPAVHITLGPGTRADQVEFIGGPATYGAWLFAANDLLVVKVKPGGASLVLSSVRAPGGDVLSIKVERLDTRIDAEPPMTTAPVDKAARTSAAPTAEATPTDARPTLRLQVAAHVRARGDMSFTDVAWAGRVGPGLWIESFSVRPLERFGAQDIEYKGLTASGFETPWINDDRMCGTKGLSVPLVGFAVRLKPSTETAVYDCEYSGYFQSGVVTGPLRNGAPCRSTVANDPLEGVQIRIVKRIAAVVSETTTAKRPAEAVNPARAKTAAPARSVPAKAFVIGKTYSPHKKKRAATKSAGKNTSAKTRVKTAPRTSTRTATRSR